MHSPPLPRVLILDYYDSYTNNLLTLFTQLYSDAEVLEKVVVIKVDTYTWQEFQINVLPHVDCIILSPGPGRPDNPADIGFALDLLRLHPVPILGVCLGHQAIAVAFGGEIVNTPQITHGHVVPVALVQPASGLFASPFWTATSSSSPSSSTHNGHFEVVVYNSLTVEPESLPDELEVTAWSAHIVDRPRTIQGLRHKELPIWGVQYHPESISSTRGSALLQSFVDEVHSHHNRPAKFPRLPSAILRSCAYRVASSSTSKDRNQITTFDSLPTPPITPSRTPAPSRKRSVPNIPLRTAEHRFGDSGRQLRSEDLFEAFIRSPSRKGKERAIGEVWLDGQTPTRPTTCSLASPSFVLTYCVSTRNVTLHRPATPPMTLTLTDGQTFWNWFSQGQEAISASLRHTNVPDAGWQGGWVGWFAYEMKEESLQGYKMGSLEDSGIEEVDACWAWCDRLLERQPDGEWIARAVVKDSDVSGGERLSGEYETEDMLSWLARQGILLGASLAETEQYFAEIQAALSSEIAIRQGESYELTMTTRFESTLPIETDAYELYLRLRTFNPAYYSAYMHFPTLATPRGRGLAVLSSSPERFLKIDGDKRVEMMPIKGTKARVKPGQCVCATGKGCEGRSPGSEQCQEEGREEDTRRGEALRTDDKERAENLMIVDLIRSDLLSCCIPSSVTVPKLIALESYGVHNLVTTVQGSLAPNVGAVEAVKRCFPPGSMTGAPKLRSVQLLDDFEQRQRRGIYSGALGYFSVNGTTDLSVVIRTIVKEGENLSIGAGGAITWLSDRDGEWEEVLTKVKSVVGALEGVE